MESVVLAEHLLLGDAIIEAFYVARTHEDPDVSLCEFDRAIDLAHGTKICEDYILNKLRSLPAPTIGPMVASVVDIFIICRILGMLSLSNITKFAVGSADSIGFGYGAMFNGFEHVSYFGRSARDFNVPYINLGLLPTHLHGARGVGDVRCALRNEANQGIAVTVDGVDARAGALDLKLSSWLAWDSGDGRVTVSSLDRAGLEAEICGNKAIKIFAKRPESAIRFAAICGCEGLLCLDSQEGRKRGNPAVITKLSPTDRAPVSLMVASHSRRRDLTQWLGIPPLPLGVPVSSSLKGTIEKHLSACVGGSGV
jgi:hypothetical protein